MIRSNAYLISPIAKVLRTMSWAKIGDNSKASAKPFI